MDKSAYFSHSTITGDLSAEDVFVVGTSIFIGSENTETNWNTVVANGAHLLTQLNVDDLSVRQNYVLGNTKDLFKRWVSAAS